MDFGRFGGGDLLGEFAEAMIRIYYMKKKLSFFSTKLENISVSSAPNKASYTPGHHLTLYGAQADFELLILRVHLSKC